MFRQSRHLKMLWRRDAGATSTRTMVTVISFIVLTVLLFVILGQINSKKKVFNIDQGALFVADEAAESPFVNTAEISLPEFDGLGLDGSDQITLASFNRAVGLTFLILMNVEEQQTKEAKSNGKLMVDKLRTLGKELQLRIDNGNELNQAFEKLYNSNRENVFGNEELTRTRKIESAFFKKGTATNVYMDFESLPPSVKFDRSSYFDKFKGKSYLKGYTEIAVGDLAIVGTPVNPGKEPFLIRKKEFEQARTLKTRSFPSDSIPHNSFIVYGLVNGSYDRNNKQNFACSVIGVRDRDFVARIPYGYIKFVNKQPAKFNAAPLVVSDGSGDLFNNELYSPSHIYQAANGVFTTNKKQMEAWIEYNTSGHDKSFYPPSLGFDLKEMRFGTARQAPVELLEEVKELACDCSHTMYNGFLTGPCISEVNTWRSNYKRRHKTMSVDSNGYSALEWAKVYVLRERCKNQGGDAEEPVQSASLPAVSSGMRVFDRNEKFVFEGTKSSLKFTSAATPLELFNHAGFDTDSSEFELLLRRVKQIIPGTSKEDLIKVLKKTKLELGSELYLHSKKGKLVLDRMGPKNRENTYPDGKLVVKETVYNPLGSIINAKGDANYKDAPFSCEPKLKAIDRVNWTPSSGYQNCLGVFEFETVVKSEGGTFSCPN